MADVTGVYATGSVGQGLVYNRIVPDQDPSYSSITPSQSPSWSAETPSQDAEWSTIAT
jgi:hypothetical protein